MATAGKRNCLCFSTVSELVGAVSVALSWGSAVLIIRFSVGDRKVALPRNVSGRLGLLAGPLVGFGVVLDAEEDDVDAPHDGGHHRQRGERAAERAVDP